MEMGNLNTYDSSSRHGSVDPTGHHRTDEETSFGGEPSGTTSLNEREKNVDEALHQIKSRFPKFNPAKSSFTFGLDVKDRVIVRLKTQRGKHHLLFDENGELNAKLPKKITDNLGLPAKEIYETNEEKIARHQEKIDELRKQKATTSDKNQIEEQNQSIGEEQDAINQLERANEKIEQRMELRDRVKAIFKKYGFTVFAVTSAVGVVIGVIVANLKNGLTSLGKGVGNGLKTVGKKLGEILPGLVGAIASFVFRTAGEVVGFLAKNAWLLIVGVVIYLVEQFKKKK